MTKLYGAPGCHEIAVNCLKYKKRLTSGERWTQTAREEDFLLVDTGQNDQNSFVPFATVGNLEKLYEAKSIYIDELSRPAHSCSISSSEYIQCIMAICSTYVTQSTTSQHLVQIGSITFFNVLCHFVNFPLRQFPLCQFPLHQH